MEASKILNADILDIIFDGKNKEYGAYELRKSYNKRIITALVSLVSVLFLFFLGSVLANVISGGKKHAVIKVDQEVTLEKVPDKKPDVVPPPPPPPKMAPPPKVEIAKFTPPKIVPDDKVKEDEKPPEVEKVETAKIGAINQEGTKDEGVVAPPVESKGTGTVVAPKVETEDYDKTFTKVENPATFPGGMDGWRRFLERNLVYPEDAVNEGRQGVIRVQLVVDKEGYVSEVKALNPEVGADLAAEAEKIIRKGPKWNPAEQNGRKVTYRFVQAVTFQISQ